MNPKINNSLNSLKKISALNFDLAVLFLLSLGIRFFYAQYRFWVAGDSHDYLAIAKNLAFFKSFAFTGANGEIQLTAFRPLLYSLFIATFWTETENEPPIQIILLLQIAMGVATVILTYLIAAKHFNRLISFGSALLVAFSPMTIHFTAAMVTESLFTFLTVVGCFFWGNKKFYLSGIFLGLASLTRPVIFPFLILFLVVTLLPKLRHKWREHLIIAVITLLIALPWISRNSLLFNKFTLTQASGYGTSLLYGSIDIPLWGNDTWTLILTHPLTQPTPDLDETEQDRLRMKMALDRISENPIEWLRVRAKQYPRLFIDSGDHILGEKNVTFVQAFNEGNLLVVFTKLGFAAGNCFLFILFWVGLYVSRRRFFDLLHIFLFPLFMMMIHLPMWIETRYFLPALPLFYISAAVGLYKILKKFRKFLQNK